METKLSQKSNELKLCMVTSNMQCKVLLNVIIIWFTVCCWMNSVLIWQGSICVGLQDLFRNT